jgi:hypothetical protein
VHTPGLRIAAVPGAAVSVIAVEGIAALACSVHARAGGGAGIAVVAGGGVIGMNTAGCGVAGIGGADIRVITADCSSLALEIGAAVIAGAEIVVIAGLIGAVRISTINFAVPVIVNTIRAFFRPQGNTGNLDRLLTLIKGGIKCGHGYVVPCALVKIGECVAGDLAGFFYRGVIARRCSIINTVSGKIGFSVCIPSQI